MTAELWDEIRELNRRLDAMLRAGSVQSVNGAEVVIEYPDGVPSQPMPYLASSAAFDATPTVGDQAFVFMPGGDPLMACALCGVSSTGKDAGSKSGAARQDKTEAELDRIWTVLTTWTVTAQDGGGQLQTDANTERTDSPPDVGADKVKVD